MCRFLALALFFASVFVTDTARAQTCPAGNERIAPDSRYINHTNGTVTDSKTALMWKQCSEGQSGSSCTGTYTTELWQTALNTANSSTFANYSDWRLPSAKELQSLVETGCHGPSINITLFPNTPASWFWTVTSYASGASGVWGVNFNVGYVDVNAKSGSLGVRLVRAAQ